MARLILDATGRQVTKTLETLEQYGKRANQLIRRSASIHGCSTEAVTMSMVLDDTVATANTYAKRTVAYDRAVLRYVADKMETMKHWSGSEAEEFRNQLDVIEYDPKPPKRTSAKKAKKITSEGLHALVRTLEKSKDVDHQRLLALVFFGVCFPMRPTEWFGARIGEHRLTVSNAKNSNGRSHSPSRDFPLDRFTGGELQALERFLRYVNCLGDKQVWKRELKRLLSRLHTICKNLGLAGISYASLRGISIAMLKREYGPVVAGYFSGHVSDRTSQTAYPRSNTAPKGLRPKIEANAQQKAMVKVSGRSPPARKPSPSFKRP